jgi:signal transduction histidine kinase
VSAEREELLRLRRYNRDLAACLALPALWGGREPGYIGETLLDVLLSLLNLDFVHLRIDAHGIEPFEATRPIGTVLTLGAAVDFANWADQTDEEVHRIEDPEYQHLHFLSIKLGQPSVFGIVVAGSARQDFPTERDRFLLRAACHQAAIALRNAFLVRAEKAARAESEAANRAKDEFFAMLSHEVRNPLGAIGNAAAAMRLADPERIGYLRGVIERQTGHLSRIIDDLLDVSRMVHGKISIERSSIDMKEVVEAAIAALREAGKLANHQLEVAALPAPVNGDGARLSQVFVNLLENAIKYTPQGGHIWVTLEREGRHAILRVKDDGIGIPSELLPRIFEPFVQRKQALDRAFGGLGLGLTVVKRLVEMHEGDVRALSGERGSEFVVRIPLVATGDRVQAPRRASSVSARRRVLIVEDNEDARESLRLLLEAYGHAVEEARDGNEGIEKILGVKPDVALVDVGLPGIDGFEVARMCRASSAADGIYLVALTGYGQPRDRQRALEAGFDEHLVKPVDADRLLGVLSSLG